MSQRRPLVAALWRGPLAAQRLRTVAGIATVFAATLASASNGLNQIGFGTESALMAGADTAVARDTASLNTNPAGLAQIAHRRLDLTQPPHSPWMWRMPIASATTRRSPTG
jgi:hypothetical protein